MLRKLYVLLAILLAGVTSSFAQSGGGINGKVIDKATREGVPFAVVTVSMNGVTAGGAQTDLDGEFTIKPLNAGVYVVKVQYTGYQPVEYKGVIVSDLKTTYLTGASQIELTATSVTMSEAVIIDYKEPLIDPDTKSGGTVTREEFLAMPSKNINSVASTTAGVYQADEGKALNMRGMRDGGTAYFIDGQRVIGSANLPQQSIEQVSVITGGVPAQFGDATGGVINITTRGPQSQYFGGVELITSELLDSYGYNFVGFSVGGPIWMKTIDTTGNKRPVLGFILSGEGSVEKDPDPSAGGTYKVKDDKLHELEQNPLRPSPSGIGFVRNTEFVRSDDLEKIKARQNVASRTLRLNAKLDFKPTENLNITFGGSIDYNKYNSYIYEYALFNPSNNPLVTNNTWRVYARLTQRFGSQGSEGEKSASNIKNAYYTLQVGYTKVMNITEDESHKDNYFDYGHIGTFHQYKTRTFAPGTVIVGSDTLFGIVQTAYSDSAITYSPNYIDQNGNLIDSPNPLESVYTNYVFNNLGSYVNPSSAEGDEYYTMSGNGSRVQNNLGLLNGDRPGNVYSLWYNTGRQYNGYTIEDKTQFRVATSFSADIKNHAIQVGFEFEQRNERGYALNPLDLWGRMRQLANYHTTQLDLANPQIYDAGNFDVYLYDRFYDAEQQKYFDKSMRQKLGMSVSNTDFLDIDAYGPDFYTLDMFSAEDMLLDGNNIVSYFGYDHTGKRSNDNATFEDFFTQTDANGNLTRASGAFRPIYMAGYIQDKFDFKDLKFNVGLRIDRFDANQKVLKDKFLFQEALTVKEVGNFTHPDNMGDDFVVYTDGDGHNAITGYRNGSVWYDNNGNELSDPSIIANQSGGTVHPWLVDESATTISMKAFKDYQPQINFMPRIAFAFPISEEANFFAHYDVLTQRPTDGYRLDPLQYYYIANRVGLFNNNPDLKPQRTTDYELGFTQTLSARKNAAITISAFYREFRDMIQVVAVNYAYPANYNTYGNIDFGTAKGFTVAYDLRRTNGVQLTASYTLQFADGTGSGATAGVNLINAGQPNLRTTIPLDFDQRHAIVANVDYRFGSGGNYHGPVWTSKKNPEHSVRVFDNVGANMVFRAGSGTPFTQQSNVTPEAQFGVQARSNLEGSINGSRLPWQVRVDLRIDKNVDLKWGGSEIKDAKLANLNIYLQVLNVLNTRNIQGVYRYTGNPTDDGYLSAAATQSLINGQNDPSSFRDLYSVKVNNPANYSIPRRIRIGVMLDF
ncbi:MAG: carboxypeptidase regulatory-like domain-containing protein [Bacteroidota bacterium]|nr:carboxypeptidase regulatory-like domain-containing protein [Bacteroidota bacterium]